jgi:hypothetical protein
MRAFRASMPEYPVRSLMRCEAMKILPCSWSITLEKRFVIAVRRFCFADGSSAATSAGSGGRDDSSGLVEALGKLGGLESSA